MVRVCGRRPFRLGVLPRRAHVPVFLLPYEATQSLGTPRNPKGVTVR